MDTSTTFRPILAYKAYSLSTLFGVYNFGIFQTSLGGTGCQIDAVAGLHYRAYSEPGAVRKC